MRAFVPILCASLTAIVSSTALYAAPSTVMSSPAVLTQGTPVKVRLETDLRSGRDKVGEPILFTVDQDVYDKAHQLVLKKGTQAHGSITESSKAGSFGHAGRLVFTCDYAVTGEGTRIPLVLVINLGKDSGNQFNAEEHVFDPDAASSTNPEDYQQSAAPGGFYSQIKGSSASVIYDPGRFFGGADKTADRGQKYTAKVAADTTLPD